MWIEYHPIPDDYLLLQAYPNPFNPTTQIQYALPDDIYINIIIYDILGREVTKLINSEQGAGYHTVTWNGYQNASGLYFVQMTAGDPSTGSGYSFVNTQKLMLVK